MRILSSQAAISLQPFFISLLVHKTQPWLSTWNNNLPPQALKKSLCPSKSQFQFHRGNVGSTFYCSFELRLLRVVKCLRVHFFSFVGFIFRQCCANHEPLSCVCAALARQRSAFTRLPLFLDASLTWRDVASRRSYPKTFCLSLQIFFHFLLQQDCFKLTLGQIKRSLANLIRVLARLKKSFPVPLLLLYVFRVSLDNFNLTRKLWTNLQFKES